MLPGQQYVHNYRKSKDLVVNLEDDSSHYLRQCQWTEWEFSGISHQLNKKSFILTLHRASLLGTSLPGMGTAEAGEMGWMNHQVSSLQPTGHPHQAVQDQSNKHHHISHTTKLQLWSDKLLVVLVLAFRLPWEPVCINGKKASQWRLYDALVSVCWVTSSSGVHNDVTLTHSPYLDIAADQVRSFMATIFPNSSGTSVEIMT